METLSPGARIASVSACCFGVAGVLRPVPGATLAAVGLVLLLLTFSRQADRIAARLSNLRLFAAMVATAFVAMVVPYSVVGDAAHSFAALPATAIVAGGWSAVRKTSGNSLWTVSAVLIAGVLTGAHLIGAAAERRIDVVLLHEAAADALARGENVFGPAVSVPDGSPEATAGSMIVGYPYPPIVAVGYGVMTWFTGESRWMGLAAWLILMTCAARIVLRRDRGILPFLVLAALPGFGPMIQGGWTEMLSAALVALSALFWTRPWLSGLWLGLGLSSKQYLALAMPLILFAANSRWQRASWALATAACVTVPAFALAPPDAWQAMVISHSVMPIRVDSVNLAGVVGQFGVTWAPPLWVSAGFSVIAFSVLGRRAIGGGEFWRALAAGLAVFFLLSRQAMPNYWYFVATIAALSASNDDYPDEPSVGTHDMGPRPGLVSE
jgi:Glycosyltransferase family 87